MTWLQWLSLVEIPVVIALAGFLLRSNSARDERIESLRTTLDARIEKVKDELNAHKVYVAENYLPSAEFEVARKEIVGHLIRIEQKIDKTAAGD